MQHKESIKINVNLDFLYSILSNPRYYPFFDEKFTYENNKLIFNDNDKNINFEVLSSRDIKHFKVDLINQNFNYKLHIEDINSTDHSCEIIISSNLPVLFDNIDTIVELIIHEYEVTCEYDQSCTK